MVGCVLRGLVGCVQAHGRAHDSDDAGWSWRMTTTQRGNKSTLMVGDTQVEMFSGGSGPAVMFLHGAGGNAGWQDWHEELARDYKIYVPSQAGFNSTERP